MKTSYHFALAFILLAVCYVFLTGKFLVYDSVWISDEGNRVITMNAMVETGRPHLAMPENADLTYYPPPYFVKTPSGKTISAYSPFFPLLASMFRNIAAARLVLSFIPALICALFCGFIAMKFRTGKCPAVFCVLAAGFATPLLFYSAILLEINLFSMIMTCIFFFLILYCKTRVSKFLTFAALLILCALFLREETYIAGFAIVISLMAIRLKFHQIKYFIIPLIIIVIAVFVSNYIITRSVFGLHSKVYNSLGNSGLTLFERFISIHFFVFKCYGPLLWSVIFSLCFYLAAVPSLFYGKHKTFISNIFLGFIVLASIGNFIFMLRQPDPVMGTLSVQSLCASVPFVFVPLIYLRELWICREKAVRLAVSICILSIFGIAFALNYKTAGIFFGPRHYVFIIPLILPLVFFILTRLRIGVHARVMIFMLLLISAGVQLYSVRILGVKKDFSQAVINEIRESGITLAVTDVFWLPEELPERAIYIRDKNDLESFKNSVKGDFVMILSQHFKNVDGSDIIRIFSDYKIITGPEFTPSENSVMAIRIFKFTPTNK